MRAGGLTDSPVSDWAPSRRSSPRGLLGGPAGHPGSSILTDHPAWRQVSPSPDDLDESCQGESKQDHKDAEDEYPPDADKVRNPSHVSILEKYRWGDESHRQGVAQVLVTV
jgi:hypothetical protein